MPLVSNSVNTWFKFFTHIHKNMKLLNLKQFHGKIDKFQWNN